MATYAINPNNNPSYLGIPDGAGGTLQSAYDNGQEIILNPLLLPSPVAVILTYDNLGITADSQALILRNTTPTDAIDQEQNSPAIYFWGSGWDGFSSRSVGIGLTNQINNDYQGVGSGFYNPVLVVTADTSDFSAVEILKIYTDPQLVTGCYLDAGSNNLFIRGVSATITAGNVTAAFDISGNNRIDMYLPFVDGIGESSDSPTVTLVGSTFTVSTVVHLFSLKTVATSSKLSFGYYTGSVGGLVISEIAVLTAAGVWQGNSFQTTATAAKPAADVTQRGKLYVEQGGGGARDRAYVCLKGDAGGYSWVEFANGGA